MSRWLRYSRLSLFSFLGALLFWAGSAIPSYSHWADLAVAEVVLGQTETQITLTLPTGLVASADDNQDGQLSAREIGTHSAELQSFLSQGIRLTDSQGHRGVLTLKPLKAGEAPSTSKLTQGTHSTLLLTYTWPRPVQGVTINYDLFLPGVSTASCQTTILQEGQVKTFVFTPTNREFSSSGPAWLSQGGILFAVAGAFMWGTFHSMSPGHGKTVVGAYLVGSQATAQHALFLGLATTIAHTTGVFALGLVTLFASNHILPERLYPWLSVLSGLVVVVIGINLLVSRLRGTQLFKRPLAPEQVGFTDHHSHSHAHPDHHHQPELSTNHNHHSHSHLPPSPDGKSVTWQTLLALAISGGLLPCPAAMVLLLSAISRGYIGLGLLLVLAFSLGLAGVLTGLGLLLVYAKRLFEQMPTSTRLIKMLPFLRMLPVMSALVIVLLGLGITVQAVIQADLV